MSDRTLVTGACVVTVDSDLGVMRDADILIEDTRIVQVGKNLSAAEAKTIDATDKIVIPGLVDNHRHTWQTPMRGLLGDGTQRDYLKAIRLQMAAAYRPQDNFAGNYVGALEALANGVTTIVDYSHNAETPDHAEATVDGLERAGIRAVWAMGYLPGRQAMAKVYELMQAGDCPWGPTEFNVQDRDKFFRHIAGTRFASVDQLLTLGLAPAEMVLSSVEEVVRAYELGREVGALVTHHTNPAWFPPGDIHRLGELGLLDEDVLLVHCTLNTEAEWEIMRAKRPRLCVCPESEMQMAMGNPATSRMRSIGLEPSLGVDTVTSNGGDLFAQMRLALQTDRHQVNLAAIDFSETEGMRGAPPPTVSATAADALRWATLEGARGAGLGDQVGSITPGKRADLVILDPGLQLAGWDPERPESSIVLQATPANVDTVLVDGRVVKENGRLTHVDVSAALNLIADTRDALTGAVADRGGYFADVDVPV